MTTTTRPTATDAELDQLIATLALPAKVRLLTGASGFTLADEPSIGLTSLAMSDGPTGVRGLKFDSDVISTLLPNATLLAAAWSTESAYDVGRILAEEAAAQEIHLVLGPTINLHRSPLGGRLFEAYSEDPLLSGKLAAAYITGLQSLGIGACPKHLVANESETERNTMNALVDEATLREVYLLPFEIAVAEGRPWSMMSAYNRVNGCAATEHDEIQNRIVKDQWGFDGVLVSDWHATRTAAEAATGGLDLVMPGPAGPWGADLVAAVRRGAVGEDVIDEHVRRVLRLADRVGVLGGARVFPTELPTPTSAVRREQMTRLAASGITVLTNRDATLPLASTSRVALIGRHALHTIGMGGGSAIVHPPHEVSVAEAMAERIGDRVVVRDGVPVRNRPLPARDGFLRHPETGEPGVEFRVYDADGTLLETRVTPECALMVGVEDDFPEIPTRVTFRATLAHGGPIELGGMGAGAWTIRAGDEVLRFELDSTGGFGEEILAPPTHSRRVELNADRSLTGEVVLRPRSAENANAGMGRFGLLADHPTPAIDDILAGAAAAAADCDTAVVVVGLTDEQETESVDKQTLALPGAQDRLVSAVAAAAPRTVVVVNAATPVLMPWLDEVDAIVVAGLPGQEAGHAIAATLVGELEPSGRLVTSFPAADGASPAWSVTPIDGEVDYAEGPFVGYRGYADGRAPQPTFWFGHGLGYGTWTYADPRFTRTDPAAGLGTLSVTIRNTGSFRSREVVQVYGRPADPAQPIRLVGWTAATVDPGATATVTVSLETWAWRRWDTTAGRWETLPWEGELLVARGLGDVRCRAPLSDHPAG